MHTKHHVQRIFTALAILITISVNVVYGVYEHYQAAQETTGSAIDSKQVAQAGETLALEALEEIEVKGRAPRTGYDRDQFSSGWGRVDGCDMRNIILQRDLEEVSLNDECQVVKGVLDDPLTGKTIVFARGPDTSAEVHIDHVVAVSDAWQKGAQQLSYERRYAFYNDPLNLIATQAEANMQKGDSDAASWLPPNRSYRCDYVARQIAVKAEYDLWVTSAERDTMSRILSSCADQLLPQE